MPDQELAGDDALKLIATCNLEDGDDADAIARWLIFFSARLLAPLPTSQTKRSLPGRREA